MKLESLNFLFPQGPLQVALLLSLLGVWMLVGLFYHLNRYTKRNYFSVWMVAWLFYALWLMLPNAEPGGMVFMFKQWSVAISTVLLLWGSLRLLGIPVRQLLFGIFMLFLIIWTWVSSEVFGKNELVIQLPAFIPLAFGSIFVGLCFFRLRMRISSVGAGMLSLGFQLWGLYLAAYPFLQRYKNLSGTGFFIGALLQLFIAVSMIIMVLEDVRFTTEQIRLKIDALGSEKEAFQVKVLNAGEEGRDFYNQVRLKEGLQKAYEELHQAQEIVVQQERLRSLGQIASGIAHDINNALSPIVSYSELVLAMTPQLPEEARKYLEIINGSGLKIAHLAARMLEFSRQRSETEGMIHMNVNQIVDEAIEFTRPSWRDISQRNGILINIQTELEPGLPLLFGNPIELRESLTNLIFNAVDALSHGGKINIVTRSVKGQASVTGENGEGWIQIEVHDNGKGMDTTTLQHCLEPFFSTKSKQGSSGLGLAMVHEVVQRYEGKIDIDSFPGAGTRVLLNFPVRKEAAKTAASTGPQRKSDPPSEGALH